MLQRGLLRKHRFYLVKIRPAGNRRDCSLASLVRLLDPCLMCLDLRLGLLLKHMWTTALGLGRMNEQVLALMMVMARQRQSTVCSLSLGLWLLMVIQIMEARWQMMQIFISACLMRLITMIVWRKMAIVAEIFLRLRRLVIYVNKSRSFRPIQGQEMGAQMHR